MKGFLALKRSHSSQVENHFSQQAIAESWSPYLIKDSMKTPAENSFTGVRLEGEKSD